MNYRLFWSFWFFGIAVIWLLVVRDWITALQCLLVTGPITVMLLRARHKQKHEPPLR